MRNIKFRYRYLQFYKGIEKIIVRYYTLDEIEIYAKSDLSCEKLLSRDECIGAKDKNGDDIYESDIVLTDEGGWIAEVAYQRDGFYCRDGKGGFSSYCNWEKFEVIGNIHENSALLKRNTK